eukprot:Skav231021  [mRNA]  locus=scaffold1869:101956:103887:- [translate_table: standard]
MSIATYYNYLSTECRAQDVQRWSPLSISDSHEPRDTVGATTMDYGAITLGLPPWHTMATHREDWLKAQSRTGATFIASPVPRIANQKRNAHALTMAEAEKRIDPEDGKARTFDELVKHYKSVYTFQQVQQYWDNRCRPEPCLRKSSSEIPSDIPTDPFLTSLQQPGPEFKLRPDQPPTAPASQVNLGPVKLSEDPFLAASFNQAKHPPALSQVHQTEAGKALVQICGIC